MAILYFLKLTKQYSCKVVSTTPQQVFYDIFVEIEVDNGVVNLVKFVGILGCSGCKCGCWVYLRGKVKTYKAKTKNRKYTFNVPAGDYVLDIPKMCYKTKITL